MPKKFIKILFYAYLLILTWGILFKFATQPRFMVFFMNARFVNLIPFAEPLVIDGRIVWEELAFNIVSFLPYGMLLPMVKPSRSVGAVIVSGFTLSVTYEFLQYLLAIGMADVTDVLMNTLGTCCGLLLYRIIRQQAASRSL